MVPCPKDTISALFEALESIGSKKEQLGSGNKNAPKYRPKVSPFCMLLPDLPEGRSAKAGTLHAPLITLQVFASCRDAYHALMP